MRYARLNEGNIEYFAPYKGGLILNDNIIINPTEEQYNEAGWYRVEFVDEVGTDHIEGNVLKHYVGHERTLEEAKQSKIAEIESYDTSDAVNGFTYQGQTMWIDKNTRVGLVNAVNATKAIGKEEVTFGIQGISVTMPCDTALAMLARLEVYALECYNVTLEHKNVVNKMRSIAKVDAFDVATDYPEQLNF